MKYPDHIDLPPLLSARGVARLPGSKSISNRILLLSALSHGTTEIHDLLHSDDTDVMLNGLRTLGVSIEALGGHSYRVQGCAGGFPVKEAGLFLGNAGTAFRPLTAALALSGGCYRLSGVPRMHERPIGDLVDALRRLGADIRYLGTEGFPPLEIYPASLSSSGRITVRGDVSSQFLSSLLMALPLFPGATTVGVEGELISRPYIDITLAMMACFGVQVARDGWSSFTVPAGSRYTAPGMVYVEGDASSASYFLAAGAIGGGPVRVEGVGHDSIQGDVRFVEALQQMGARITMGPNWIEASAPESGRLQGIDLDCNHIPDAAMTLAVCALFADGVTTLRNIASWRVKETDRIDAMAAELRKFGAKVEDGADFLSVSSPCATAAVSRPPVIDTYDDHRMAMCFSLAAFGQTGVRINDPQCVAKTFPDYFECLHRVVKAVPVIAIDGPSASGKGTVAQRVAEALGFHYLDSGALYRMLSLAARRQGIALDREDQLADLAGRMEIRFEGADSWLDDVRVTDDLRSEESAVDASIVALLPSVRAVLVEKQRAFRRKPGLVADGRDMASVVFPDAALKIFLTASAEVRAERRYKQLIEKGMNANISNLLKSIRERDERDSQRSVAPMQQVSGAILLDTSSLTIGQAVQEVLARYHSMSEMPG